MLGFGKHNPRVTLISAKVGWGRSAACLRDIRR